MEEVRSLFGKYVRDGRPFAPGVVACSCRPSGTRTAWGCPVKGPDTERASYQHAGVSIECYRRFDTHLGDTDTFTDRMVVVDGETLLNEKWT
jgi:hypothetical protein